MEAAPAQREGLGKKLPEGIVERETGGTFDTPATQHLSARFLKDVSTQSAPVLEQSAKYADYEYGYLQELLAEIFELFKREGEIVAFRRGHIQRELFREYQEFKDGQAAKSRRDMEASMPKDPVEEAARWVGEKLRKLAVRAGIIITKPLPPEPESPEPKHPGQLAIAESTFRATVSEEHRPITSALNFLVRAGLLKKISVPFTFGPNQETAYITGYKISELPDQNGQLTVTPQNREVVDFYIYEPTPALFGAETAAE